MDPACCAELGTVEFAYSFVIVLIKVDPACCTVLASVEFIVLTKVDPACCTELARVYCCSSQFAFVISLCPDDLTVWL